MNIVLVKNGQFSVPLALFVVFKVYKEIHETLMNLHPITSHLNKHDAGFFDSSNKKKWKVSI